MSFQEGARVSWKSASGDVFFFRSTGVASESLVCALTARKVLKIGGNRLGFLLASVSKLGNCTLKKGKSVGFLVASLNQPKGPPLEAARVFRGVEALVEHRGAALQPGAGEAAGGAAGERIPRQPPLSDGRERRRRAKKSLAVVVKTVLGSHFGWVN